MNPFDLTGPQFLLFYLVFSALVIMVVVFLRRSAESPAIPKLDLSDPYLIAYLRGGEPETLRVATVALIDRKLLVAMGTELKTADNASTRFSATANREGVATKVQIGTYWKK